MRTVIQRVNRASVLIDGLEKNETGKGLMVLCAFEEEDNTEKIKYVANKIVNLRIFSDEEDKLNLSLLDIKGEILIVSNFTLYGNCDKGRRPNFTRAAKPEISENMYNTFVNEVKSYGLTVKTGKFGADMFVDIQNDGPVTVIVESK